MATRFAKLLEMFKIWQTLHSRICQIFGDAVRTRLPRAHMGHGVFVWPISSLRSSFSPRAQSDHSPIERAADRIPSGSIGAKTTPPSGDKGPGRPAPPPASCRAGSPASTRSSSNRATRYSLASLPSCPAPFCCSLVSKPYLACPLPHLVLTVLLPPSYGICMGLR